MAGDDAERHGLAWLGVAGAVQELGAVEPVDDAARLDLAEAGVVVVGGDDAVEAGADGRGQWTIFERGISMRSVAPALFRSGISTLIWSLATTVSTA